MDLGDPDRLAYDFSADSDTIYHMIINNAYDSLYYDRDSYAKYLASL